MENDLSLSQVLGGLRIANNPDDTPPRSPVQESADLENKMSSDVTVNGQHIQGFLDIDGDADSGPLVDSTARNENAPHSSNQNRLPYARGPSRQTSLTAQSSSSITDVDATFMQPHQTYSAQDAFPNDTIRLHQSSSFHRQTSDPFAPPSPYNSSSLHHNAPMDNSMQRPEEHTRFPPEVVTPSVPGSSRIPWERSQHDRSYNQTSSALPHNAVVAPPRINSVRQSSNLSGPYGLENGPPASSEEWMERGAAVSVRREVDGNGNQTSRIVKKGVKDFNFGRTLGEGSYSTVLAATDRQTLTEYAIKVLDKRHIIKEKKVKYVNIEKNTLNRLGDHPGIVRLYYTFQDERSLYFVLDLAAGGELLGFVKKMGSFDEECTRYYSAQILDAVEYMHSRGVIHRDLKPENVLLDDQMRVKITDFGTAKLLDIPKPQDPLLAKAGDYPYGQDLTNTLDSHNISRANSFVGTAEYVSPELLTDKSAFKSSDLWAFGCILFQLLSGRPPFKAANEYQTFQKIVNLEYAFPAGFPLVARDLVERLLVLDPTKRITIEHIKSHQFFDGVAWGRRLWKQKAPRLKAYIPPLVESKVIKLDSASSTQAHGWIASSVSAPLSHSNSTSSRPMPPKVITELPPPTQLDLEWSPILTRSNERILKLGNLTVLSAPAPHPHALAEHGGGSTGFTENPPKKLSRFFQSSQIKKRQRLVMITSSARIIIAGVGAGGGDASKVKSEIDLLGLGVVVRLTSSTSSTGTGAFTIDTREKSYTFEDTKISSSEWMDTINRARDLAGANYIPEDAVEGSISKSNTIPSPSSAKAGIIPIEKSGMNLARQSKVLEQGEGRGSKRFSKRHSKNGLAAVF